MTPMNPTPSSADFREQLSAWHDGALPDEASRFVMRRLLSDDGLRAEVGRWQLLGDALRREAQHVAPRGLAEAVQARIDADEPAAVSVANGSALRADAVGHAPVRRRGPMGGLAVAAAVGLAAVLLWPKTASDTVDAPALAGAATSAPTAPSLDAARIDVPVAPIERSVPRVLVARVDAPAIEVASTVEVPPLVRAPQPTPEQLAPLPAIDAPSRPWPRSAQQPEAFVVDYAAPGGAPPRQ